MPSKPSKIVHNKFPDNEPISEAEARGLSDAWIVASKSFTGMMLHLPAGEGSTEPRCHIKMRDPRRVDVTTYPEGYFPVCSSCRLAVDVDRTIGSQMAYEHTCRSFEGPLDDSGECPWCSRLESEGIA